MSTTPQSPRSVPQASRADGEAIDWSNVAVETAVMLRLQGPHLWAMLLA